MNDLCVLRIYSSKGDRETPKQQEGKYCVTFFSPKFGCFCFGAGMVSPQVVPTSSLVSWLSHLTCGFYLMVTNGCSSSNKHVHITTSKEGTKAAFYPHRRTIHILRGNLGYVVFISGDFVPS